MITSFLEGVPHEVGRTDWWKKYENELPQIILQSSAAGKRVFSILTNFFNDSQRSSLEDYIETFVMLQYNWRTFFFENIMPKFPLNLEHNELKS